MTLYNHTLNGLPLRTGDVLCTRDGRRNAHFARIWRLLGLLIPGEIDHCALYLGPGGRYVESATRGVILFDMPGETWRPQLRIRQRLLIDELIGVAYPLAGRGFTPAEEAEIRRGVAAYCLDKAARNAPFNYNFFNPESDGAFYCSQLVYKAYLALGVDLNTNQGVPAASILEKIVFPQEIWNACAHRRADVGQVSA